MNLAKLSVTVFFIGMGLFMFGTGHATVAEFAIICAITAAMNVSGCNHD